MGNRCFLNFARLFEKKWLQFSYSKYCPSLATTFSHLFNNLPYFCFFIFVFRNFFSLFLYPTGARSLSISTRLEPLFGSFPRLSNDEKWPVV